MINGYMCIVYPNQLTKRHITIDDVVADICSKGAETVHIFHNLDNCEPHYHIVCMWVKSAMPWDDFVMWMKSKGCKAPKKGTNIAYDLNTAYIKDIDAAISYLLHEDHGA